MLNPWPNLSAPDGSYVLDMDRDAIREYNQKQPPGKRVILESIPEPFIGNPESARLVLLSLNPGHSVDDATWHSDLRFRDAMFRNLRHEHQDYPFYPLNPLFQQSGVARWWRPLTRELQVSAKLEDLEFAAKLMVIEWFPYHSERSGLRTSSRCSSQIYSFHLAKQMLQRPGVSVILMRSQRHWSAVDSAFETVPCLNNVQRPFITKGNMDGKLYEKIIETLRR